jgi:hypothetical protein
MVEMKAPAVAGEFVAYPGIVVMDVRPVRMAWTVREIPPFFCRAREYARLRPPADPEVDPAASSNAAESSRPQSAPTLNEKSYEGRHECPPHMDDASENTIGSLAAAAKTSTVRSFTVAAQAIG